MAIDKTIPNRLQTDADQRLVRPEVGEMMDALNVTIAENGANSAGIIKNARGTVAATADAINRIVDGDPVTVIGSVSDHQRGFIYWFVSDDSSNTQHAIYQYNTSDDTYALVIKGSYLNFSSSGFVKGDIVNAAFQQDGEVQSILYFTDNVNPPRKVNVDRAIAGAFDGLTSTQLDYCLNVVKPAPTRVPRCSFSTDSSILLNNFTTSQFQVATQFIYTDGEESAISGYSKLTFPDTASIVGLEQAASAKLYYEDNVCEIDTRVSFGSNVNPLNSRISPPDVEKIRILARQGNSGSFFVVDEFNISENLDREVYGSNVTVYNRDSGVYRWYNDGSGSSISSIDQNKLYDNVPFEAQGISVTGNRLMMSNYTEGRPNHDPGASMSVNYNPERIGGSNSSAGSPISWDNTSPANGGTIGIDLTQSFSSSTQTIPSGSRTVIQFEFDPSGSFRGSTDTTTLLTLDVFNTSNFTSSQFALSASTSSPIDITGSSVKAEFNLTITNTIETTPQGLLQFIADELEGFSFEREYTTSSNSGTLSMTKVGGSSTIGINTANNKLKTKFKFDDYTITSSGSNAKIEILPYISDMSFVGLAGYPVVGQTVTDSDGVTYNTSSQTFNVTSNSQDDMRYAFDASLTSQELITSTAFVAEKSFKWGSTHELGVVYYDKFNRSGNVNRIGSFYVNHPAERSSNYGSSSVTVSFTNDAPSWAERYQFVYPGNSTYSSWVSHTVGGGFYEVEDPVAAGSASPNGNKKLVYVSLNTLENAKSEKGSLVDYSFTKGDKLRVVSYDSVAGNSNSDPSTVYPKASDDSIIEFNVLGVKVLAKDNENPLVNESPTDDDSVSPYTGTFLVLDAPQVNGGVGDSSGTDVKYSGFDWFSISNTAYPDTTASSNTNFWNQRCVVEILTPRVNTSEKVWYEIGEDFSVATPKTQGYSGTNHGFDKIINGGEAFFRAASMPTPYRDGSVWTSEKTDYRNENVIIESQRGSDYFGDKSWDRGRAHVVFEDSATVRRQNGITYSDAYAEDVANLSLSSFNPSLANFFSLDSANGACNYIGTFRDDYLLAFQENRVSRVPVNKDIITSPSTGGIVSLSTNVLNSPAYYSGDFGCGDNPESVLIRDGNAFFVDTSRKKVVRLSSEGMSAISENGADSLFKTNIDLFEAQNGNRIVSGYDPEDDQYYVTIRPSGTYNGLTLGYNVGSGVWQSRYSFVPNMYSDQNGTMYSALYVDPDGDDNAIVFHSHSDNANRNTFYGTAAPSVVRVASNYNPSMVKVFNAVSIEGDSGGWVADPVVTDLDSNAQSKQFVEKEGSYYSEFTRDENGTKHIMGIGTAASVDGTAVTITFNNRVNRNPIPYGAAVRRLGDSVGIGSFGRDFRFQRFVDAYTIEGYFEEENTVINTSITFEGQSMIAISNASVDGDPVRGHWADITLTNNQTAPFEMFCVNTHFVESKQNHSLGQQ